MLQSVTPQEPTHLTALVLSPSVLSVANTGGTTEREYIMQELTETINIKDVVKGDVVIFRDPEGVEAERHTVEATSEVVRVDTRHISQHAKLASEITLIFEDGSWHTDYSEVIVEVVIPDGLDSDPEAV